MFYIVQSVVQTSELGEIKLCVTCCILFHLVALDDVEATIDELTLDKKDTI